METDQENIKREEIWDRMLAGEPLTEGEKQALEEGMKDERMRREYYRLRMVQGAVFAEKEGQRIDVEGAWEAVQRRRQGSGEKMPEVGAAGRRKGGSGLRMVRWVSWVAATVAVSVGVWMGLRGWQGESSVVEQRGGFGHQVVLMLSDGRQVALSDGVAGKETGGDNVELLEWNGVKIRQLGEQLVYTAADSVDETAYNTLRVPRGAEYRLQLADGSTVWLNAESELRYPVSFREEQREVFLSGEAFFEVESDREHPFVVHTDRFAVRVTGTEFNVRDYPEEHALATLAKGRVEVLHDGEATALVPGEQAILHQQGIQVKEVDLEEALAWRQNAFCFKGRPLEELLNEIGRWYDLEVFYLNPSLKDLHFTAWFKRNNSVEEVVKILEKTQLVKMELKGKTLIISEYK